MPDSGGTIAEVAHIEAHSPGGPRFNPAQESEDRQSLDNLLLLCPSHHALIDRDTSTYTAAVLKGMKIQHEAYIHQRIAGSFPLNHLEPIAATQLARQVDASAADFAIVTALPQELAAVLEYFPTLQKVIIGESRTYYQGIVVAHDGTTKYRVVVALLQRMGNVQAAAETAELIRHWMPRYVVMCGIAGGLHPGKQRLGDVVISTDVVYYELGKVRENGLERRPVSYMSDPLLIDRAMHMHLGSAWRARLPQRPDNCASSATVPAVHFAPVASGDKVIASEADVKSLILLHPKLAAVEMEGGGVAASAMAAARRIGFFMVRSICDFADDSKNDNWQKYAAHAAASFLSDFLSTRPVAPTEGPWAPSTLKDDGIDPKWVREVFFPKMCKTMNMEELCNFCFVLQVDTDDLTGSNKTAKIRDLLLRAERRGRLQEIVKAYEEFVKEEW
ncbi:hypothetical protein EN41_06105 [Agrobacterium tumefaciens]|nr:MULTISPECIES: HNH endonuclease [Agrobacterium]KEY51266.1 hypothetical protein EN41_06105 [Agrobacterium tumefaciens]